LIWLLISIVLSTSSPVCSGGGDPEDELKAATVLSFLRYSEWPDTPATPITVGVFGRNAMLETLRIRLKDKSIDGHAVKVVELRPGWDGLGCDVIYIGAGRSADIKQALDAVHSAHVLTIGESNRFLELGGAINLLLVYGRISFEFSRNALEQSGFSISSKLLRFGQVRQVGKVRPPA